MFKEFFAVALLFLTRHTFAQNLEAILSDTRLPEPAYGFPVVYDGEDSIYVLGGEGPDDNYQKDILKFDVIAATMEKVGTMDPVASGSAVWLGNEILYFGGRKISGLQSKVFSYKPDGETNWGQVGDLPRPVYSASSVWGQEEYSYIFGGDVTSGLLKTISRYSSVTNTSIVVGELPRPSSGTSAVWDETTGDAYLFGGGVIASNDIVRFNPAKETVETLNVSLPFPTYLSCAVWTGADAYIIGGTLRYEQIIHIFRFNPSTNKVQGVPVNNLRGDLFWHGCAFVKKQNRIYVFGGSTQIGIRDEILYIDLDPSPTNPTTTTPTTTTITTITTTTNKVVGTGFPDPFCYLLALVVSFHLQ